MKEGVVPTVGDAVVTEHVKHRILRLTPHAAHLAKAGPSWRHTPVTRLADPGRLEWDNRAGVWRGPSVEAAS